MPLIQISLRTGRSARQLHELAAGVTRAASEALGAPASSIRVIVAQVPPENWFVGGAPLGPPSAGLHDDSL
ncbi:MAG: 4-oxalocrotonate tautomerase family protein [Phenylobacterium sp.]|uniref:tautomerase family protein n=1 Tax=Phenylobacterium sp. TaxID=1871053 RepID=UPI001A43DAAC|nr:4-oxalocrotonate tautomerase family protein [Phenylobacterium sp.]MBL8553982.1 4-oxalocrotonate tautomerase family protein [Phenylobacterium sp.]